MWSKRKSDAIKVLNRVTDQMSSTGYLYKSKLVVDNLRITPGSHTISHFYVTPRFGPNQRGKYLERQITYNLLSCLNTSFTGSFSTGSVPVFSRYSVTSGISKSKSK